MQLFEYRRPESLRDVADLLESQPDRAALLAGGTDLIVQMQSGVRRPEMVIDLKRVRELSTAIEDTSAGLRIGALTVLADVAYHPGIGRQFPALAEAAGAVGSVQIRNRATLAGNICNASPAADTATPLLVYNALVNTFGAGGGRTVPIREFFTGPGRTVLGWGEIVESVDLPYPNEPTGSAFLRVTRRRGVDLACVNVACLVTGSGQAKFAFGAVGPTPIPASDDSGVLLDEQADPDEVEAVLERLAAQTLPISDIRAGKDYRRAMVLVLSRRALKTAVARLKERM